MIRYLLRIISNKLTAWPVQGPHRDYGHEFSGTILTDDVYDGHTNTVADGVIYVVSGCGGQGLHDGVPTQSATVPRLATAVAEERKETWQPFTLAFNGESHGYSSVAVDGQRLEFTQCDLHGMEIDRMVVTKK